LNKFINLLGITGALQQLGPQSSTQRPEFIDYSEKNTARDPGAELLLDLYKTQRRDENIQQLAEEEAAVQLRRNQTAIQQAQAQLLAQALSSFGAPKSVI
jgi:hypothetical protein